MQIDITSFEKNTICPYFRREKRLFLSLVKKDFKVFLNCVVVVISFMLAGSVFQVLLLIVEIVSELITNTSTYLCTHIEPFSVLLCILNHDEILSTRDHAV